MFQEGFLQPMWEARETGEDAATPWADERNSQLFLHGFQTNWTVIFQEKKQMFSARAVPLLSWHH